MRDGGRRINIFVSGAGTLVDCHSAAAFRMVLGIFNEAPHFRAGPDMWHDQTLASGVEHPGNVLILQIRDADDRGDSSSIRMGDEIDHGFKVIGGMLRTDHHEVHSRLSKSVNHPASLNLPHQSTEGDAAGL